MLGKAMLTMVTSRKAMNTATDVTRRTFHLRCMMQRTLHDSVASRYSYLRAAPHLRRRELLDRPLARADRRALDAAGAARGVPRRAPFRRVRRPAGHRPQRAHRAADAAGRRGRARAPALPGAPGALRVPPDRERPAAVPGVDLPDEVGRPLVCARRPAARRAPPRVRRRDRRAPDLRALRRPRDRPRGAPRA